jgi:8-oxo-dGTP pyrophosphatase MutT (NUDIX family)
MGDFQPDAHKNGFAGWSFIALICNRKSASCSAVSLFKTMTQKYALYSNGKALLFNNPQDVQIQTDGYTVLSGQGEAIVREALRNLSEADDSEFSIFLPEIQPELGFALLKKILPIQTAAGGILQAPDDYFLFIKRLGRWDLPKGKPEGLETPLQTAIREVIEETGVPEVSNPRFITNSYHTYPSGGETILKETVWYHFHCSEAYPLKPQTEEAIEEAGWIKQAEVERILPEAWPSVRDVWNHFTQMP